MKYGYGSIAFALKRVKYAHGSIASALKRLKYGYGSIAFALKHVKYCYFNNLMHFLMVPRGTRFYLKISTLSAKNRNGIHAKSIDP